MITGYTKELIYVHYFFLCFYKRKKHKIIIQRSILKYFRQFPYPSGKFNKRTLCRQSKPLDFTLTHNTGLRGYRLPVNRTSHLLLSRLQAQLRLPSAVKATDWIRNNFAIKLLSYFSVSYPECGLGLPNADFD